MRVLVTGGAGYMARTPSSPAPRHQPVIVDNFGNLPAVVDRLTTLIGWRRK
jgi:hypothetical protein